MKPVTQPPGAGIPWLHRMLGRGLVVWRARQPLSVRQHRFTAATAAIIALCRTIPVTERDTPVLIAPLVGLEDSSRFWSVNMTLEHVMIVTKAMTHIIQALNSGQTLPFVVGTADVKPTGDLRGDSLGVFEQVMTVCADALAVYPPQDFKPAPRHAHPWFGPLSAAHWHALLSIHHGIHLQQLQQIRARRPRSPAC